ncbi:Adenylate cyclase type 10 [Mactra antiquata]
MSVTFLGNSEYRHYVELGPAISSVNTAEHFCHAGMVVISPDTWNYCDQDLFELETVDETNYTRVLHIAPPKRKRSHSLPAQSQGFSNMIDDERKVHRPSSQHGRRKLSLLPLIESVSSVSRACSPTGFQPLDSAPRSTNLKSAVTNRMKKFGKLRKIVTTVTEMRLDIALRLYILHPVLKKLDDNQPLEYLSEMRQVSILFMNLVLDESANTEMLLQEIFEIVYSRTKAMHGAMNKVFLFDKGCTFLVLFGLPGYKHENDCAHALMCSGRMKSQLDKMEGVQRVSIGVTTGTTFCGVVGHPQRHEYSVIGRKVNMAARLMMHYPDKVTCDTDTYQACRLPLTFFDILVTKRMKGLNNIGVIRQFIGFSKDEKIEAKCIKHSVYPTLGRQYEDSLIREQLKNVKRDDCKRRHLVFSGPSGIGKTKVLDQALFIANQEHFKVVSCRIELEDSSYPYFLACHVLRSLLDMKGYSEHIDKEPLLLEAIGPVDCEYLYVLNNVLGIQIEKPVSLVGTDVNERAKRKLLFRKIVIECCDVHGSVIVIDDAHNIDTASWDFLCELISIKHFLIILSVRPAILDSPSCREALYFFDHHEVKVADLSGLQLKFVAALACQMMNVVSIPKDLDYLLRERSHGVPAWCLEILRDLLENKDLVIVNDNGRRRSLQSSVVPSKALISTNLGMQSQDVPSESRVQHLQGVSATELVEDDDLSTSDKNLLQNLGYLPGAPAHSFDNPSNLKIVKSTDQDVGKQLTQTVTRKAVFATGVEAEKIPIPPSMKELIIARIDSMRATEQLVIKCAAVVGKVVRRDILEILLPKAHRPKIVRTIRRLIDSGIFTCSKISTRENIINTVDEGANKHHCYCSKSETMSGTGEPDACFEPMFTHQLLQETAYEVLMESQRMELHSKAANYLELSADELKSHIPYHVLFRPPDEDLEEQIKRVDNKLQDVDAVIAIRTKRIRNKVEDEAFAQAARKVKSQRGRRDAIFVSTKEAFPLVLKIAQGGVSMDSTKIYIENLLTMYDGLIRHRTCLDQQQQLLVTLAEACAAAIAIEKHRRASYLIKSAVKVLEEIKKSSTTFVKENSLICARINRLHGKTLYKAGDFNGAYYVMAEAAGLLGIKESDQPKVSRTMEFKLLLDFLWYWRFQSHMKRVHNMNNEDMEQGYLFEDLFRMDKELGYKRLKFIHAVKHFFTIVGKSTHVHQVVSAYTSMVECCRERGWASTCEMLQSELLMRCAEQNEELSTQNRSCLCEMYGTSCVHYMVNGNLKKAEIVGKAAADICISIHDEKTTKEFAPYYFFLCLFTEKYYESILLLQTMNKGALSSKDPHIQVLYKTICVEIGLAGGIPPDSIAMCIESLRQDIVEGRGFAVKPYIRNYAIITTALWFARYENWTESKEWCDCYLPTDSKTINFFSVMAELNCIECMLLTMRESSNRKKDKNNVKKKFKSVKKSLKKVPVLQSRFYHLKTFHSAIRGNRNGMNKLSKLVISTASSQGNLYEIAWLNLNKAKAWNSLGCKTNVNERWIDHSRNCEEHLLTTDQNHKLVTYILAHKQNR